MFKSRSWFFLVEENFIWKIVAWKGNMACLKRGYWSKNNFIASCVEWALNLTETGPKGKKIMVILQTSKSGRRNRKYFVRPLKFWAAWVKLGGCSLCNWHHIIAMLFNNAKLYIQQIKQQKAWEKVQMAKSGKSPTQEQHHHHCRLLSTLFKI